MSLLLIFELSIFLCFENLVHKKSGCSKITLIFVDILSSSIYKMADQSDSDDSRGSDVEYTDEQLEKILSNYTDYRKKHGISHEIELTGRLFRHF